jgi:hypothetical protein
MDMIEFEQGDCYSRNSYFMLSALKEPEHFLHLRNKDGYTIVDLSFIFVDEKVFSAFLEMGSVPEDYNVLQDLENCYPFESTGCNTRYNSTPEENNIVLNKMREVYKFNSCCNIKPAKIKL